MNRPGDASGLTDEERAAWIARVRAMFAEQQARGEIVAPPASTEARLEELEQDQQAGRDLKFDLRCSADEKLRWAQAAHALGLSASEFLRDVANSAADEFSRASRSA